ncbi:MAG: imidazolonepropionase [Acidobacteria bacterium]|nr:MAG: imidazolonepropionase [Acidobacteriota bacterium]
MTQRISADLLVVGASELVTCAGPAPAAGQAQADAGVVERGALAARDGTIVWTGPEDELERAVAPAPDARTLDVGGRAVLPALVDCHTHLVWAGDRTGEFARRLAGATYSEIAAAGGGILSTVEAVRAAPRERLAAEARERMRRMARWGTTGFEIKSGYGLSTEAEIKLLRAAGEAVEGTPFLARRTFLGAHTLPREARGSRAARARYVDEVVGEMIPRVAEERLARFCDVFIDEHAFTVDEARRVLEAGRAAGLEPKLHAAQLAPDEGVRLAAELGAVSVDHLEHATDDDLDALARAGTVGVLLPGATLFLRMTRFADGRRMIDRGVPVAVATDVNPGSCPSESLPLMMQLACLRCGLSVDEAIVAATKNAAVAAGLGDRLGTLEPGRRCDLLVLEAASRSELLYALGSQRTHAVLAAGRTIVGPPAGQSLRLS